MKPIVRLTLYFLLCCFEFLSLGFFSLIPLAELVSILTGEDKESSYNYNSNVPWILIGVYILILFVTLINYFIVFGQEVGILGCCTKRKLKRTNRSKFHKRCGKSPPLFFFLLPIGKPLKILIAQV